MPAKRVYLAVFAGGMIGALLRVGLNDAAPFVPGKWPWVTFGVNLFGAFLVGVLDTYLREERDRLSVYRHALLTSGFCGALTTFATLQFELLGMVENDYVAEALAYVVLSVGLGIAFVTVGSTLVRMSRARRV